MRAIQILLQLLLSNQFYKQGGGAYAPFPDLIFWYAKKLSVAKS